MKRPRILDWLLLDRSVLFLVFLGGVRLPALRPIPVA
jgi:hypothetical protein